MSTSDGVGVIIIVSLWSLQLTGVPKLISKPHSVFNNVIQVRG